MSKNSLYPTTPSGICVTSIIKDKIREYMMSDSSPNHAGKSSFDISTSAININVTTENSTCKNRHDSSMKDVDNVKVDQSQASDAQDAVSTTDFGLPSSLDVSIHNACEPCPHRQDIVAASVRRIGNSLDALFRESKQATHVRAIKKTPNSESSNLQNSDTIFATAGEKIRYRKGVTLHDICEEYIQFITVNSSTGSADEDTVTTTCETDSHKRCPSSVEPELEIIPIGIPMSGDKRIAQISVITINESLTGNVKKHAFSNGSCDKTSNESHKIEAKPSTAIESVEETHPPGENDCEKSSKTESVCDVSEKEEKMDVETNDDMKSPHESFVPPSVNGIKPPSIELDEKMVVSETCNDNSDLSKVDDETFTLSPTTLTNGVANHETDDKWTDNKLVNNGEESVENDVGNGETSEIPPTDEQPPSKTESVEFSHSVVDELPPTLSVDKIAEVSEENSAEKSTTDECAVSNDVEMKEISGESTTKSDDCKSASEDMETDKSNEVVSSVDESDKETKTVDDNVDTTDTAKCTLSSEAIESSKSPTSSEEKIPEPIKPASPAVSDDSSPKQSTEDAVAKETTLELVAASADNVAATELAATQVEPNQEPPTEIQTTMKDDLENCSEEQNMAEQPKKAEVVETKVNVESDSKNDEKKIAPQVVEEESTKEVGGGVKRRADLTDDADADREGGGVCSSSSSVSGSEGENNQECKRIRFDESIFEEDERERLIREFVERSTETADDISKHCEKLQQEITALSDLARAKELEWNSIMRLLKLKEEMLERIQFRKRHLDSDRKIDFETVEKIYKNFMTSAFASFEQKNKTVRTDSTTCSATSSNNNQVIAAPVSSSSVTAAASNITIAQVSQSTDSTLKTTNTTGILTADTVGKLRSHRPILPKPSSVTSIPHPPPSSTPSSSSSSASSPAYLSQLQVAHPSQANSPATLGFIANSVMNDQNSIVGEGRQGTIKDVKSIIADFRSKNPDSLPRRGRRNLPFNPRVPDTVSGPRFLPNTALLSMANMALGSGSHVRTSVSSTTHNDHRTNNFLLGQDGLAASLSRPDLHIRPANIDSLMLSVNPSSNAVLSNSSQQGTGSSVGGNLSNFSNNTTFSFSNSGGNSGNSGANNATNNCFQEALVKFAKMNEKRDIGSTQVVSSLQVAAAAGKNQSHLPPPPPYPEVTLHPVLVPQSSAGASPVQNSLLHGILTKSNSGNVRGDHQIAAQNAMSNVGMNAVNAGGLQHRPTTFSPTLARLLTAPERNRTGRTGVQSARNSKTTLSEILHNKKSRTEVTITPVTTNTSAKPGSDVVLVDDDDETDPTDRLVIDEGREVIADGTPNVIPADQVPECQGCHKKAAQFVCAGCGNQWYCSRECQVQAWEDHSEMCSG